MLRRTNTRLAKFVNIGIKMSMKDYNAALQYMVFKEVPPEVAVRTLVKKHYRDYSSPNYDSVFLSMPFQAQEMGIYKRPAITVVRRRHDENHINAQGTRTNM